MKTIQDVSMPSIRGYIISTPELPNEVPSRTVTFDVHAPDQYSWLVTISAIDGSNLSSVLSAVS